MNIATQAQPDLATLAPSFFSWLQDNAPAEHDNLDAWRDILLGPRRPVRPEFDSEATEEDLLGVSTDVEAFARLLGAQALQPPLAIGLFGDWGSGKTFFMRSLQQEVESLSHDAGLCAQSDIPTAYHAHVVQIEFNAWNYVEANLWASLVTHIFEHLHQHFSPQDDEVRKQWERLLKRLGEETGLRADAEETLTSAEDRLATAQKARDEASVSLGQAVRAAWTTLKSSEVTARHVKKLEDSLGLDELRRVQESILLRGVEARELVDRLPGLRGSVVRGLGSVPALGWFLGIVALVLVTLGLFLGIAQPSEAVQAVSATIAEIVAVIGGVTAWFGVAFRKASGAIDAFESLEGNYQKALEGTEQEETLRDAEREVTLAQDELQKRRDRIAEIRARLDELRPSERLSRFLEDRASSSDYRKHLGLPAMIRRDFDKLHRLMRDQEPTRFSVDTEEDPDPVGNVVPEALRTELSRVDIPLPEDGVTVGGSHPTWTIRDAENNRDIAVVRNGKALDCSVVWKDAPCIDRIILYIDDLDRCPSERVVQVLEAVHLLLTFPLFVVVVGVDARWVSRALREKYEKQWQPHGDASQNGDSLPGHAATPHDYLEKIFQVPFWLQPISPDGTKDLLRGLLAPGTGSTEPEEEDEPRFISNADADLTPAPPEAAEPPAPADPELTSPPEAAEEDPTPAAEVPAPEAVDRARAAPDERRMNPEQLVLDDRELEFIESLAASIARTPRAVKRFANVYRLIRARETDVDAYLRTKQYKVILWALSVVVGHSDHALEMFAYLRKLDAKQDWEGYLQAARASTADFTKTSAWYSFAATLADVSISPDDFKDQLKRVGRFSFRVGRL